MTSKGYTISRVRGSLKAVKEDAFVTDRYIYSVVLKYAKAAIRRQDNENKLMRFSSLFRTLPCVELVDVDRVEACCGDIKSDCIIKRTKDRLPGIFEGALGPIFRTISSIDGSEEIHKTEPAIFTHMTNSTTFKYNKRKYYWFIDGYLYFPNIEWDAIRAEIIPEDDVSYFLCDEADKCIVMQDQPTNIPDYLFEEIEAKVLNEILTGLKIPTEGPDDKQSLLR